MALWTEQGLVVADGKVGRKVDSLAKWRRFWADTDAS